MTHLLGRQDCVDSLRRDLTDLQGAVLDVFSRTGPVRFSSWKFPDKLSCDLDLVNLLEQYDYVEGEAEFNQHSHIVLLELVIDRLMLLLQSFNAYVELISGQQRTVRSGHSGPSVSIGPVVKRYWNSLIKFSKQQQPARGSDVFPEDQRSTSRTDGIPSTARTSTSPAHLHNTALGAPAQTASVQKSGARRPTEHKTAPPAVPAHPTRSVSSQTTESALVSCKACAHVQAGLKETAEAVVTLCQSLGLSCSLQRLLVAMEHTLQLGRLSVSDVALWVSEQRRDMEHLSQHMTEVQGTVESLKERVRRTEEERDKLRTQLKREEEVAKREREERRRREEEWERRLEEVKARGEEEQEELKRGAAALETTISKLTAELDMYREINQCLECERDSLVEKVHSLHLQEVTWGEVEEKRRDMEVELSSTQKLLDKECAKYHSAQRQQEAMKVKQRALLERVEVLVQQYEDVQTRLEECEGERAELTDALAHTRLQIDTLQEQLTQQKSECHSLTEVRDRQQVQVCELEATVSRLTEQLQQAAERERMLVAFPELSVQQPAPQSTGDVLCDMEQQLKANTLRIRVLEQENTSLSTSLSRLRVAHTQHHYTGDHSGCTVAGVELEPRPSVPSPSSTLQQQTLSLHLSPDMAEVYNRTRAAARTRSAAPLRRRK